MLAGNLLNFYLLRFLRYRLWWQYLHHSYTISKTERSALKVKFSITVLQIFQLKCMQMFESSQSEYFFWFIFEIYFKVLPHNVAFVLLS